MGMVRVFVLTEDPEVLSAVHQALEAGGAFEILATADSQEALSLLAKVRPKLILVDQEVVLREGIGLPARMYQISSAPVLFLMPSAEPFIPPSGAEGGNGLVARIREALASARIQTILPGAVL